MKPSHTSTTSRKIIAPRKVVTIVVPPKFESLAASYANVVAPDTTNALVIFSRIAPNLRKTYFINYH